jgi:hypothetical protein
MKLVLILVGIAMMIEGFSADLYSSYVLIPTTAPPVMRPIEGADAIMVLYRQAFLISGIAGVFVTIAGVFLHLRQK